MLSNFSQKLKQKKEKRHDTIKIFLDCSKLSYNKSSFCTVLNERVFNMMSDGITGIKIGIKNGPILIQSDIVVENLEELDIDLSGEVTGGRRSDANDETLKFCFLKFSKNLENFKTQRILQAKQLEM